ncbi:MAG TPA: glycosyltransferase family 39 protein, partial [Blastocatellia bacterium]|nr:glycosyltransferase family 39 protein [Blastocatellia bacterium]
INEFAARFPSAISAIVAVGALFYGLWRRVSARLAFFGCLVLLTSPLFIGFARAAVTDMPLTAAVTVSLVALYLAVTGKERERIAFWLLAWAAAGVAVLAKGLVGFVLFAMIGVVASTLAREWGRFRWRDLLLGVAVFVAVCSTWYGPVIARHGWPFIQDFFINHHFKRYLTNEFHHPEPLYFYPFIVLAGLAPWTFYLIPAAADIRTAFRSAAAGTRYLVILAWTWLLTPLLFFSLSESKLPSYILPAFPGAAILIGLQLDKVWTSATLGRSLRLANVLTSVLTIGLAAVIPVYVHKESIGAIGADRLLLWMPLVVAGLGALSLCSRKLTRSIACTALLVPVMLTCAFVLVLPPIRQKLGIKDLSIAAAKALRPGEKIGLYLDKEYAPVFYAQGRIMCGGKVSDVLDARTTGDLVDALSSVPGLVVITRTEWVPSLARDSRLNIEPIAVNSDEAAFRVTIRSRPGST